MVLLAKKRKVSVDTLKYLFYKTRDKMMTQEDVLSRDITHIFYDALEDKIRSKELLNIAVKGEVRTGKSTVAIAIMDYINRILIKKKLFLRKSDERDVEQESEDVIEKKIKELNWATLIQSDQIEFVRFISNKYENCGIVIDEWSWLGKTGVNATTEEAVYNYYSDVFAGKYLHRVSVAPDVIADPNATYVLEVIGKGEGGITRCKLSYRNIGEMQTLVLGYVDVDVSSVLEEEYYKQYKQKKFKRMSLLDEEGIRDVREMEFADVVMGAFGELVDLAGAGKVSHRLVLSVVESTRREMKRIYSLVAVNEIANRVSSMVELQAELGRILATLKKEKMKEVPDTQKIAGLGKGFELLKKMLSKRMLEEQKLMKVYHKYMEIK